MHWPSVVLLHEKCQKKTNYQIDLKHFLFAWDSHEVVEENAQLKASLEKMKQVRESKEQGLGELGEPASKRQCGAGGGSLLNSGVARKPSGKKKGTFVDDDDDDHEGPGSAWRPLHIFMMVLSPNGSKSTG